MANAVQSAASRLSSDVRELSLGTRGEIERLFGPPSPLRFLRDFVMPGKPCIISNAIDHWPALRLWSNAYLRSVLKHQLVSVHFTPDGYADALVDLQHISSTYGCVVLDPARDASSSDSVDISAENGAIPSAIAREAAPVEHLNNPTAKEPLDGEEHDNIWFVSAYIEHMPFPAALDSILASGRQKGTVAYAQQQNGCFLTEYGKLAADAETHLPWATEALGCMPEAVNLWIGNEKAVTSFHKDHYENLYAVIAGEKHFTLLPPTDVHALYLRQYPSAHYTRVLSSSFSLVQKKSLSQSFESSSPTIIVWCQSLT